VSASQPPETPSELTASIQLLTCPTCGQPVTPGSRFCSSCGVSLVGGSDTGVLPSPEDSGPLPAIDPELLAGIAPGEAVLLIHRGPEQGTRFELRGDQLTAGRAPDATIFLDDVTVSRRHAVFSHGADGWTVADVGSLNGSYVNRNRIDEHLLVSGDEVQIGKYRFLFFQAPIS
jgi:Inner membrane component of T3SS, cytoplasmic domain/zinc-ribbon domain